MASFWYQNNNNNADIDENEDNNSDQDNVNGWKRNPRHDLSRMPQVLRRIFSFWTYNELLELDLTMQRAFKNSKTINNENHPAWVEINYHLTKTRNITLNLDEASPMEPARVYPMINRNVTFNNITTLHLNIVFNFDFWVCPIATFRYDFTHFAHLRHLSISNALLECIQVRPENLVSLRLLNIFVGRNTTSYPNAFNEILSNAINLEYLNLDDFPEHFHIGSDILHSLAISRTVAHKRSIAAMLSAHALSLRNIRLQLFGRKLTSFLSYLNANNISCPGVTNLTLHLSDIEQLLEDNVFRIPFINVVFPQLTSLTFAITDTQQLKKCINFCLFRGIYQVILKPDPGYSASIPLIYTAELERYIAHLNIQYSGFHKFTYINQNVTDTF